MILPGAFGLRSAAIVSLSLRLGGLIRFVVVILHHARQVLVDLESFRHFVQNDQLIKGRIADRAKQSTWSDRRRCAVRGLSCEFRRTHSSEPQAERNRS